MAQVTFTENRLKVILYAKETDLTNFEEGTFDLKEMGKMRVIHQSGDSELEASSTPYRFEGDTLILNAATGALKGTWRRLKEAK